MALHKSSLAVLFAMMFSSQLALTIFLPAVPDIARDLETTLGRTQLIIPAYLIAFAFMQLIVGPLSDRFGRRPVIMGGVALFMLASLCVRNGHLAIAWRALFPSRRRLRLDRRGARDGARYE